MVDPQRPRMTHVVAQGANVWPIAARAQSGGIERRQAPVLALGIEAVRRGPNSNLECQLLLLRPGVRAVRAGTERKIAVETDRHAALGRLGSRDRHLAISFPLEIGEK